MNENSFLNFRNIKTVIIITLTVTILSLIFSFLQTPKYESSVKLLVFLNQPNMDAYTTAQTSNYLTGVLSEVIYSNSFMGNVYQDNPGLKKDLGNSQEDQKKNWEKTVKVTTQEDRGLIFIDVYHSDRNEAAKLSQAVAYTLINRHAFYHGLGDRVSVKMIDTPVTSEKLAQPKILRNSFLGLGAGLALGLALIIIFPQQRIFSGRFQKTNEEYNDQIISLAQPELSATSQEFATGENAGGLSANDYQEQPAPAQTEASAQSTPHYYDW